jgi:hypothetical protein
VDSKYALGSDIFGIRTGFPVDVSFAAPIVEGVLQVADIAARGRLRNLGKQVARVRDAIIGRDVAEGANAGIYVFSLLQSPFSVLPARWALPLQLTASRLTGCSPSGAS